MSGIQQALLGSKGGGIVTPGLNFSVTTIIANSVGTGTARFNTDGTYSQTSPGSVTQTTVGNWFSPTTAGIGSSYWVRFQFSSGTTPNNGVLNTWQQITGARSIGYTHNDILVSSGNGTWQLATDSAGTNIVLTGTWYVYLETTG